MTLQVLPVPDQLVSAVAKLEINGYADDPGYQVIFPGGSSPEALEHNTRKIKEELGTICSQEKPTCWYRMVVDTEKPDTVLAYSMWYLIAAPKPGAPDVADNYTPPPDANKEAFEVCIGESGQLRKQLMASNGVKDYLYLVSLVTAAEARKRGCATQMLSWGQQLARELNVPCYLQASRAGSPLYRKLGWEAMGDITFDFGRWDKNHTWQTTEMMLWWPNGKAQVKAE